jgi:hypothetical protein
MSEAVKARAYLSIVGGPKVRADLSTGARAEVRAGLSIGQRLKTRADLSTGARAEVRADLSIGQIEARRQKARLSLTALLGEARVHRETWRQARAGHQAMRRDTLQRLERALDRLVAGDRSSGSIAAIGRLYVFAIGVFAERCGAALDVVHGIATDFRHENPGSPEWLLSARVRRLAMYLIACQMKFGNAALAAAIGCSRQNVKQAVKSIEELRETEPALDALIARVAALAGAV